MHTYRRKAAFGVADDKQTPCRWNYVPEKRQLLDVGSNSLLSTDVKHIVCALDSWPLRKEVVQVLLRVVH